MVAKVTLFMGELLSRSQVSPRSGISRGQMLVALAHAQNRYPLGARAYLSAGLPGAEWWVEGTVGSLGSSDVDLDPMHEFYE